LRGAICPGDRTWYTLDMALLRKRGAWTDLAATLHNLGHVAHGAGRARASALTYFAESRDLYAAFDLEEYVREEEEMIRLHSRAGTARKQN
jgi:hypothetical protein